MFFLFLTGCGGSDNDADTTAPVITIIGENPATIAQDEIYTDSGATATDAVDGAVSVRASGTVDTATLGAYTITYTASDAAGNTGTATRAVNVVDVTPPVITIIGDNPATVIQDAVYSDAGATAIDDTDGSVDVISSGTVDTSTVDVYTITYTATDLSGNESTATRIVNVEPPTLSGVAAAGAAIVGTVTVRGSLGLSNSAIIEADGNYNVDVTGLTPPYRIRAQGTVGGRTYKLYSYAEEGDVGNTVNVTPFTDLIIANTAQQIAESFFNSNTSTTLVPVEVAAQEAALQAKLQAVFDALGLDTAIDLLRTTFSADHTGLDAALDLILIGTAESNIVTITNLLDGSTITDDISDPNDNSAVLPIDPTAVDVAVSDIQTIANLFESLAQAFAAGLPNPANIEDIFSVDFIENDASRGEFLTDITTDPTNVGLAFSSVDISDLDSTLGTATVSFHVIFQGEVDLEVTTWSADRDSVLGWQLRGDQRIVDVDELTYHCNDFDGTDNFPGGCGINTSIIDENFDNNGTSGVAIASGTAKLIDGSDGTTVKHTIYLGTPVNGTAGELQIYNEATGTYQYDWRAFGSTLGEIDPALFVPGDIVEYSIYTQDLDLTIPTAPAVAVGSEVSTFSSVILYEPSTVGLYPAATTETITAIENYTIGTDLIVAWTLATGTVSDEVFIEISDSQNNRIQIRDESFASTATSITFSVAAFNAAIADNPDFDPATANYSVMIRIFAMDPLTGQAHSTDYRAQIVSSALTCSHQSGWDDTADGGLGAPINPNSFAEFESVVSACGTSIQFTSADIAGNSFLEGGETTSFFDTGSATEMSPATGEFDEGSGITPIGFQWYVENVGTNTLLVIYTDSTIDTNLPAGFSFRETSALTSLAGTMGQAGAEYNFVKYSEQSNYGDMVRSSGSDGEIWNSTDILQ